MVERGILKPPVVTSLRVLLLNAGPFWGYFTAKGSHVYFTLQKKLTLMRLKVRIRIKQDFPCTCPRQRFALRFSSISAPGTPGCLFQLAGTAQRSDLLFHQRRDEPVQGRVRPAPTSVPITTVPPRPSVACGLAASTMTWKTSAIPPVTTPSSRCWANSASVTASNRTPSGLHGNS